MATANSTAPTATAPSAPASPTFADLGARPETVAALAAAGITHAFAIQEYAIPIALRGTDLIGQAPTGTGKTLGFGVPLLERLLAPDEGADGRPQALVVVPTRELGIQVARDIASAGRTRGVRVLPIYGGVAYEPQTGALHKGVEIVVGTPGRLLDLAGNGQLKLDSIHTLVLDEADRMLDLGFLDDVEKILAMLPSDRHTMLFSATMPDPIVALARRFLHNPVTIHAGHTEQTAPSPQTRQLIYRTHPLNKVEIVARILQAEGRGLTMIFCRTKRSADRVAQDLDFRGFASAAVHGDLGQGARERALRAFRAGKVDVLVATDVAARGLDVTGVTHVINFDCPEDADAYTHRIGRTGRAGASGVAVTFVDWEDMPRWRLIDKSLGLEMSEPPETYHTSPHLFTDLDIPTEAGATLPAAERTRAGLAAEVEEDLGGGRVKRSRGRGRTGDSTSDTPRPARKRRRRRLGVDPAAESTVVGAGEPATGDAGVSTVAGDVSPATGAAGRAAGDAAGDVTAAGTKPARSRRRRRRHGSGASSSIAAESATSAAEHAGIEHVTAEVAEPAHTAGDAEASR